MKQDVLVFSDEGKTMVAVMAETMASSETELCFSVKDAEDKAALEALCKNAEATRIITYGKYDGETLQVDEVKKYAQYTTLSYMGTRYGQVTGIDYSKEDETSESGFLEQTADITEVRLQKKSYVQRQIDALKAGGAGAGTGDYAKKEELLDVQKSVSQIEAAFLGEEVKEENVN